jgi:hypothetical protein
MRQLLKRNRPRRPRPQAAARSRWRIIAAGATAALVAGTVLAFNVSPAAAASAQAKIDQARFSAQIALLRPECRRLLTDTERIFPPSSPDEVLSGAPIKFEPEVPFPLDRNTFASAKLGGGVGSTISVYPLFINPGPLEPTFLNGQQAFDPTPDQLRTILLLHEVGHLTGREGDHSNDFIRQANYNTDILNVCLAQPTSFDYVPIAIIGLFCVQDEPDGLNVKFLCDVYWTGGDTEFINAWLGGPMSFVDPVARRATGHFECPPQADLSQAESTVANFYVQVSDVDSSSLQSSATAFTSVTCSYPAIFFPNAW